jgi:hypothetical protein
MALRKIIRDNKFQRKLKRVELVGSDGVNKQDARMREAAGDPKKVTREVQQRMREYKGDTVIDKVKVYKNPGNK